MDFSLSFFSSADNGRPGSKYDLLIDASRFADRNGFAAVWTPERHFHRFGGIFPNPSLMGVLLATTTERVRIRAGSVVLPLHHPIRVAEEWSVVDNLSRGRVDVSFAVGWNPNDFILAPDHHADRVERTYAGIDAVRRLWGGGTFTGRNGVGEEASVSIHPEPVQKELPVWITCTGRAGRFEEAGARGYNVLTALIFQPIAKLARRIEEYRTARAAHGFDPRSGKVTLMLHTFVGESLEQVRGIVHQPMLRYLESSVDLWRQDSAALQGVRRKEELLEYAFERYFRTSGLFGTVETCAERVEELREVGVDEIACLIDYGVEPADLPAGLELLGRLRARCTQP